MVLILAFVLLVLPMINERQDRVVFSNGSWLIVRKVAYGTNHIY